MTKKREASAATNERVVITRANEPVGPVPLARDRSTTRVKSAERTHGAEVAGEHVARNRRNEPNRPDALVPIAIGLVRASREIVETNPSPPARAPESGKRTHRRLRAPQDRENEATIIRVQARVRRVRVRPHDPEIGVVAIAWLAWVLPC